MDLAAHSGAAQVEVEGERGEEGKELLHLRRPLHLGLREDRKHLRVIEADSDQCQRDAALIQEVRHAECKQCKHNKDDNDSIGRRGAGLAISVDTVEP